MRREIEGVNLPRRSAEATPTGKSPLDGDWATFEYIRWDPKDCELWVTRVKPEETLVEARRGADVQIALPSCL